MPISGPTLWVLVAARPYRETRAVFGERRCVGFNVFLVGVGIGHIDHGDPIALLHGFHLRKLAMRARPSAWLFSGWNCVPARLSRPTAAVTGPPIIRHRKNLILMQRIKMVGMHE